MIKFSNSQQSGRSMIEMLGVLAIIGVLSVGGIAGYSKAMTKFKVNKSIDQVSMIVTSIRTLYSGQRNYLGLTVKEAISYGFIPKEMTESSSKMTNSFAGTVLLSETKYKETAGAAFSIVYNGLGQEACVTMGTASWGSGSTSGLLGMKISNATQALSEMGNDAYTGTDLPVSLTEAAAKCDCTTATCSVAWYYQ